MADFVYVVLYVGLVAAIYSAVATWAGARLEHRVLAASARSGLFGTFGMVTHTLGGVIALRDRRRPAVSVPAFKNEIEKAIAHLRQAGDRHGAGTCSECGARNPEGGLFCPQCGTKVG